MAPGEPLLLICYSFPPNFGIGGRRWAKFAKELARRGHTVHVVRSAGRPGAMGSLWSADAERPGIVHHPLPPRYPAVLTQRPISFLDKVKYRLWLKLLPRIVPGNIFDLGVFWERALLNASDRLIREHRIRNVIVTGAPFTLLLYGTKLKERHPHIHLVSDLRDIWTWGIGYGYHALDADRLRHEQASEHRVAVSSDRLISPHDTILERLQQDHGVPASKCVRIAHAIDPDDLAVPAHTDHRDGFRMIYAGSLYGSAATEDYFDRLLQAFDILRRDRPEAFATCRLDYYITGHDTSTYEQKVRKAGLSERIRFHAPIPPQELFTRIARADLLLAFMPPDKKDVYATKFHEVFYLKCPILHVGEPGLVSEQILEKRMGATLLPEELTVELPRIISGERKLELHPDPDHSAYLLSSVTDKLLQDVLA